MSIQYYPAIIDQENDTFGISFPDFPGCVSVGSNAQEAALNGERALNAHIKLLQEYGSPLPEPSLLVDVDHDAEINEVARLLIRVDAPSLVRESTPHQPAAQML